MNKKQFDSLDESLKEKLRNCKSDAEMQKVIADTGMQELSADMLEGVSGGYGGAETCHAYCPTEVITGNTQSTHERY